MDAKAKGHPHLFYPRGAGGQQKNVNALSLLGCSGGGGRQRLVAVGPGGISVGRGRVRAARCYLS